MVRLTGKPVLFAVSVQIVTQGFPWLNPQDFVCMPLGRTQRSSDDSQPRILCGLSQRSPICLSDILQISVTSFSLSVQQGKIPAWSQLGYDIKRISRKYSPTETCCRGSGSIKCLGYCPKDQNSLWWEVIYDIFMTHLVGSSFPMSGLPHMSQSTDSHDEYSSASGDV